MRYSGKRVYNKTCKSRSRPSIVVLEHRYGKRIIYLQNKFTEILLIRRIPDQFRL